MSGDDGQGAYPVPPRRTPVVDKQTALPNPAVILSQVFYYSVDLPVTTFRDFIDGIRNKNKFVYYHQKFRRVPDITECYEGDNTCIFEAEMQWKRDRQVDQEIVKVIQDRVRACYQREGGSYKQNCAKEMELFEEVSRNYQLRYAELGGYGTSRRCLMKQKQRMLKAQAKAQGA